MRAGRPHVESVQFITEGSTVRRMRLAEDKTGATYRVVTADLPDGGTVELWVAPQVAAVLAAQLVDGPVELAADMSDYREFAVGELTGLQEDGVDCARCGRDVEGSAVAVRRVGFSHESDALVVACHPECGSSPWDVEQLRFLLEMPEPDEDFVEGSPGDLYDPTDPAGAA
jgi:hypothetical protein